MSNTRFDVFFYCVAGTLHHQIPIVFVFSGFSSGQVCCHESLKRHSIPYRCINNFWRRAFHSCSILSNRVHPTKQHSICCRSENCISLAISGQSAVDSIDSFDLSKGKVYYRFDKCGRRSDNCISLVTTATRCKIVVESTDSFDWWEWLFHSRFRM